MSKKTAEKTNSLQKGKGSKDSYIDDFAADTAVKKASWTDQKWKERLLRIHQQEVKLEYKDETRSVSAIAQNVLDGKATNTDDIPQIEQSLEPQMVTTGNYKFDRERIELESGISVIPLSSQGLVSESKEPSGSHSLVFFSPGGKIALKPADIGIADGQNDEQTVELAMLHMSSGVHTEEPNDIEVSAYLKEPVKFKLQDGYEVELGQGGYTKYAGSEHGKLKFLDTKVFYNKEEILGRADLEIEVGSKDFYYTVGEELDVFRMKNPTKQKDESSNHVAWNAESAEAVIDGFTTVMKDFTYNKGNGASYKAATVKTKLNFGKNTEKPTEYADKAETFADFDLVEQDNGYRYGKAGFQSGIKSQNIAASNKLTEIENGVKRKSTVLDRDIYTRDGFAKIENPKFEFVKDEGKNAQVKGEGNVAFLQVPYTLTMNDGTTKSGKTIGTEAVEDVSFEIDAEGNLSGEFEDDATADLNLNMIKGKSNDSESIIHTFSLGDLSIEDGYLKAETLRMERGGKIGQEGNSKSEGEAFGMDDKWLKLFNCTMKGTVATKSEKAQITPEGIDAEMAKTTFGTYEVEDFMGFLSGSIDYPEGKIEVSAKKEAEAEDSFFSFEGEYGASFPTGAGGLNVKFGLKPSASIGGKVGFSVERGKPFTEKWNDKDQLKLGGEVETEGAAGIAAEAGLEFGVPVFANIDLVLEGALKLGINGKLEGATAFTYNKEKTKLEQSNDFEFEGAIGGDLTSTLGVSSNVKFLFWNMQLFSFELFKKELGSLKFSGKGKKDYQQKGLTKGWSITSKEFTAEWFSKKIIKKYEEKDTAEESYTSAELETMLDEQIKGAEEAWATLCELKKMKEEGREDTAIVITQEAKEPLDKQIAAITKEVTDSVMKCLDLLSKSQKALVQEQAESEKNINDLTTQINQYEYQNGLSKDVFHKAKLGGFDENNEKYRQMLLPGKIDKTLYTYQNITDEKLKEKQEKAKQRYDDACKSGDVKKQEKSKKDYEKTLESIKKEQQKILDAQYEEAQKRRNEDVEKINKGNKKISKRTAIDLMIAQMLGEVSDENLRKIEEDYEREGHSFQDLKKEGKQDDLYREKTRFINTGLYLYENQSSYHSILNQKVIFKDTVYRNSTDKKLRINGIIIERTKDDLPSEFKDIVKDENMTMKELLTYALKNDNAAPEKKLELLSKAFGFTESLSAYDKIFSQDKVNAANIIKNGLAEKTGKTFKNMFSTSLDEVVKGKNVLDVFKEMEQLKVKRNEAEEQKKEAEAKLKEIQVSLEEVKSKQADYNNKLASLKSESELALKNKVFDSGAAKNVVDIYSKDYVHKMKKNKEIKEDEKIRKGLALAGIDTGSVKNAARNTAKIVKGTKKE